MFSNKKIAKFPKKFFKNKHHEHFDFAIDITDCFKQRYANIKVAFLPAINEDLDFFKELYFSYPESDEKLEIGSNNLQEYFIILDEF